MNKKEEFINTINSGIPIQSINISLDPSDNNLSNEIYINSLMQKLYDEFNLNISITFGKFIFYMDFTKNRYENVLFLGDSLEFIKPENLIKLYIFNMENNMSGSEEFYLHKNKTIPMNSYNGKYMEVKTFLYYWGEFNLEPTNNKCTFDWLRDEEGNIKQYPNDENKIFDHINTNLIKNRESQIYIITENTNFDDLKNKIKKDKI